MSIALAVLLVVHGSLHLLGFLKAFGLAALPQLTLPISRPLGVAWLAAGLACLAAAVALRWQPRWWWVAGTAAVALSQGVVLTAWADARFGTVANALVLAGVVLGFAASGPGSARAEYLEGVAAGTAGWRPGPVVTEADLAPLPAPLARYLRQVGVVGQPRPTALAVRFTGRLRGGPEAPWMALTAEQHSFLTPLTRLFWMRAARAGLPALGLHAYRDGVASMRVKLLGLVPVADAGGPAFSATETVTVLNDLCVLAPGALVDAPVRWELLDPRRLRGTFTGGGHTVSAELVFGEDGMLADFVSDDRPMLAPDGRTFLPARWSTPLRDYRRFGPLTLASRAETRYRTATQDFAYGEFELTELRWAP